LHSTAKQWVVSVGQEGQPVIAEAIALADSGDTLILQEGIYKEHGLIINKPLHMEGKGKVIIDGEHVESIIHIQSNDVKLVKLKLIQVGQSFIKEYAGIHVYRSKNFHISEVEMDDVFFGCLIEKSHNGYIGQNSIHSVSTLEAASGNGVHMWHCSNIVVEDNELSGLRDGIYFEFVTNSIIQNNRSYNHLRYGLHFMFSDHNAYRKNEFHNNGAGVAVMFSKDIEMTENLFYDNWGMASYGLLLKEINDAEIHRNTFLRNTIAINVEGSNRINYTNNNFERNGWAIKVVGACYDNHFKYNDFNHNSFDLSYHSQVNNNLFAQNYWTEYTGYDLDKDGLGDVPFRPVKLFSYIVNKTPETIVLLRSLFVFIINFSEKVSPIFTPDNLLDEEPRMQPNT
jgi:nitrous oxidase accessory protein